MTTISMRESDIALLERRMASIDALALTALCSASGMTSTRTDKLLNELSASGPTALVKSPPSGEGAVDSDSEIRRAFGKYWDSALTLDWGNALRAVDTLYRLSLIAAL
ncbi:MAG: hypothetical protein AB7R89_33375 [Dehalococcoidia bacterium]